MNREKIFKNDNTERWVMRFVKIPLLLSMMILLMPIYGNSQVNEPVFNDPNYTVIVGGFQALPGDTVLMPIIIKNYDTTHVVTDPVTSEELAADGSLGGFILRFELNTEAAWTPTNPLLVPVVDQAAVLPSGDTAVYYFQFEMVGRGIKMGLFPLPGQLPDTIYSHINVKNDPPEARSSDVMYIQFLPTAPDPLKYSNWPLLPSSATQDVIMYIPMVVNPNAVLDQTTWVTPKNNQYDATDPVCQFSDSTGLLYIEPMKTRGLFRVAPKINHAPVLAISPDTYNVTPGTAVNFTVNGSDIDGDMIYLTATNLPAGASFSSASGAGAVSRQFSWVPSANGTYTATFQLTDSIAAPVTKSVTITVSGTSTNNAPIVTVSQSSYEIMQGELLAFTVSATDPDGQSLCLAAIGTLPAGASVSPANPCGVGPITTTFSWTPNFSQKGSFNITFRGTDILNATGEKTVTVVVKELDQDRLFTSSVKSPNNWPVGGIPGTTPIVMPIDLVTSRTVYGLNFDMQFPLSIVELDSVNVTDRIPEYIVYALGQTPDVMRIITFGLASEPVADGSSQAILNAYFSMDSSATPGDYWVHFFDAWESISPSYQDSSLALKVDSGIIQVDRLGDVNLEGRIDVADLTAIVAHILELNILPKRNFDCANIIQDTIVNVIDLVGIINMILGIPVESTPSPVSYDGVYATVDMDYDNLMAGKFTTLNVRGEFPDDVAGIELRVDYDPHAIDLLKPELAFTDKKFTLISNDNLNGRLKIVMYNSFDLANPESLIPAGASDIISIPAVAKQDIQANDKSKIKISQVFLSTAKATEIPTEPDNPPILPTTFELYQNYPNPFNPATRIDFEIGLNGIAMEKVKLNVYNILGQQVKTLVNEEMSAGRHTVIWDATDNYGKRVATGIYLYRLEVGDRAESKKMLLLK
ncbi:MAG: hypothetical protein CVT49_05920 [candidate division Zixibacteria bacterium HGW-Zixibacteria-1]|nr:MAG: hypothetical protein CVT49_05920 [candidate division Zixibacteria bacterium HGW-Zixibacteria-1]